MDALPATRKLCSIYGLDRAALAPWGEISPLSFLSHYHPIMVTFSFLFWLLAPLLVIVALIDLATISTARKARILRRGGLSQQAIASRLGISRYRVRLALA